VPTGLGINPATDLIKVGATETYSVVVNLSNGSTRPATAPAWSSSDGAIATIDAGGAARGMAAGSTSIGVAAENLSATRSLRVVPDYQGSWAGTYRVTSCAHTGAFRAARACGDIVKTGDIGGIAVRFTQTRDTVSGTLGFGELLGDATGTIQQGGDLDLRSSIAFEEEGLRGTINVSSWSTRIGATGMVGGFQQRWTAAGIDGDMTLGCDLVEVSRRSSQLTGGAGLIGLERRVRDLIARLVMATAR
jgi:hypothetical protein